MYSRPESFCLGCDKHLEVILCLAISTDSLWHAWLHRTPLQCKLHKHRHVVGHCNLGHQQHREDVPHVASHWKMWLPLHRPYHAMATDSDKSRVTALEGPVDTENLVAAVWDGYNGL